MGNKKESLYFKRQRELRAEKVLKRLKERRQVLKKHGETDRGKVQKGRKQARQN